MVILRPLRVVLPLLLLAGCETPTRRPTPEELARWEAQADRTVVYTVVWELLAAAALGLCIWTFARYIKGHPPPWPRSVTILIAISTALMLWPTVAFVPLWGS